MFAVNDLTITVKDGKTKVVINGKEIVCRSVRFEAEVDEAPMVSLGLPVFPRIKKGGEPDA